MQTKINILAVFASTAAAAAVGSVGFSVPGLDPADPSNLFGRSEESCKEAAEEFVAKIPTVAPELASHLATATDANRPCTETYPASLSSVVSSYTSAISVWATTIWNDIQSYEAKCTESSGSITASITALCPTQATILFIDGNSTRTQLVTFTPTLSIGVRTSTRSELAIATPPLLSVTASIPIVNSNSTTTQLSSRQATHSIISTNSTTSQLGTATSVPNTANSTRTEPATSLKPTYQPVNGAERLTGLFGAAMAAAGFLAVAALL